MRSQVEKKLDQLKTKLETSSFSLRSAEKERWEELYGQAARALNENNPSAAVPLTQEMSKLTEGDKPVWKRKALSLCVYTENALYHSYLLEAAQIQELKRLQAALRAVAERDDEVATLAKHQELDKALDKLPGAVVCLLNCQIAANVAEDSRRLADADRLRTAQKAIESHFRASDFNRGFDKYDEVRELVKEVLDSDPGAGKPSSDDRVVR